jgi:pimeloyl-ACP methyl ester carboxylesterase
MIEERPIDTKTDRKFFLDYAEGDGELTFILNLHGGGSAGVWQRGYFPAHNFADAYRLVVAAPTALTDTPMRFWTAEADDEHIKSVCETVFTRFDVSSFWLAGHSQGGMTSRRLLADPYFADRVDGFLSLSGGRFGQAPMAEDFGPPRPPGSPPPPFRRAGFEPPPLPDADLSFIYATGEHEIKELPATSPWAERYGAGARVRLPDVVDTEPGQVHDGRWETFKPSWGREARPGTAQVFVYPNARDGRVIADIVRIDKGHTEGLEPKITEELIKMIVGAPGGKARRLLSASSGN